MQKFIPVVLSAAFIAACGQTESVVETAEEMPEAAGPAFSSDEERIVYAIGLAIGENVSRDVGELSLTSDELELVGIGLLNAIKGEEYAVDIEVYGPLISDFAQERLMGAINAEREASAAFVDDFAAQEGTEQTASGLVFLSMTEGDGEMPAASDSVRVHYHGTLRDGTVFDSSVERGTPAEFGLNQVIPCWTEGVQKIRVGGKAQLLCPAEIAYGDNGSPPVIPGGAALLFEVELLDILE